MSNGISEELTSSQKQLIKGRWLSENLAMKIPSKENIRYQKINKREPFNKQKAFHKR